MINELRIDELKDMFFYTFGIVPLQSYGAIGDGMTDNRLQLQQAIYDAIEVGSKYIFVPKGNYYYSQALFRVGEVIFVGNNIDTYIKDIEVRQFPDLWNESQASSSALVPIGGIILYAGQTVPANYLECNGQSVNTQKYMSLYETLNETTENLPETFNIPNLSNNSATYIIRTR